MPPKRQFVGKFSKKPFTKRTYNNDNDGDDSSPKRFKQSTASSSSSKPPDGARHVDEEGNFYWELGGKLRRVTVSEFKGNVLVSVREYYEKDGKCLPGKKGISLSLDQFNQLIRVLPALEEAIGQKSSAGVVRPIYTTSAKHEAPKDLKREEKADEEDEEDEDEVKEEDEEEENTPKKTNVQKSKRQSEKQPKSKAVIDSEDEEEEQAEDSEEE
ncbi:hypothetical protein AA313_de0205290 [Arthrobotrys entomopaga]|nr:hypothetical protein AA313_de0205290 [Arthrobotrys entomopaga]